MKYTIKDFNEQFATDADCLKYILSQQFPDGITCEKCKKKDCFHPMTTRKKFACAWCGFQIAPTAGTIFHKSSTPLKSWFFAIFLMTASRNGVSAKELERQLGVTYKTAFRMMHQIRQLMSEEKPKKLKGTIEADECYIGGKHRGKRGRGAEGKTPVIGVLERGGNVVAKATPDTTAPSLLRNIVKNVAFGSKIMTDEFAGYKGLDACGGYEHETINHSEKIYVDGDIHTNGIESFWAQLKRSINGTYHHVSPQHLQKYLNEFSYRHNHRHSAEPMFAKMIQTVGEQRDSAL